MVKNLHCHKSAIQILVINDYNIINNKLKIKLKSLSHGNECNSKQICKG